MKYLLEIEAKMILSPSQIKLKNEVNKVQDTKQDVKEDFEEIYNCLNCPKSVEEIAIEIDADISQINTKLTMMELEGLIEKIENGKFQRI